MKPRLVDFAEPGAKYRVARRHFGKSGEQRPQVEECSADQNRQFPASRNVVEDRPRRPSILGGVELLISVENIK